MSRSLAVSRGLHPMGAQLVSEKGPDANERPASLGNARAELAARFSEGVMSTRTTTSRRRGQTFGPRTKVGPTLPTSGPVMPPAMTEEEAAEKFSALVLPYSRGDLAHAAERTKEAAKHWKAGTRAPNSSSLITLARRIPRIREWVIDQIDAPEVAQAEGPDAMAAVMTGLQLAANMPGQEGAMARILLKQLQGGGR